MSSRDEITASWDDLQRQAGHSAGYWMAEAVKSIDIVFGEGYAENHPDLIVALVCASQRDFAAVTLHKVLQRAAQTVAEAIENLADRGQ